MHHALRALSVIGTLGVTLGACTADSGDEGIFVIKNVAPGDGCTFTADEAEPFIGHGALDVVFQNAEYRFHAQMKSRIVALEDQIDQRTVITSHADVDVTFPGSVLFSAAELATLQTNGVTHFRTLFSAPIRPNGGITDAGFTIIPSALSDMIRARLGAGGSVEALATFTVVGEMSGAEVTSQAFSYPLAIGFGTVFADRGECPLPAAFGTVRTGNVCNIVQDGAVDCCTSGTDLICPAVIAPPV